MVRFPPAKTAWEVRTFASLDEVAANLTPADDFILSLPLGSVLVQRFSLPTVEEQDFPEMVRIQIEKALPYAPEELTLDYVVIAQGETECVVAAVAVHNERLAELAQPLVSRGLIPRKVTVYASQRAQTHAPTGRSFLLFQENGAPVCAIAENGHVSFTRLLESSDETQLQMDLPHLSLSAELAGINTSFDLALLDESLFALRPALQNSLAARTELMAVEVPPTGADWNLLPASWSAQQNRLARQRQWRKRILLGAAGYGAILLLFALYVFALRFQVGRLDGKIERDAPRTEFVKNAATNWKALAPAVDPHYYPIEILLHLFESLPNPDVRITSYNQSARQISVDGEAPGAALAYQFVDKVKKNPELAGFIFEMAAPRILPNEHAQFRLEGKPR